MQGRRFLSSSKKNLALAGDEEGQIIPTTSAPWMKGEREYRQSLDGTVKGRNQVDDEEAKIVEELL